MRPMQIKASATLLGAALLSAGAVLAGAHSGASSSAQAAPGVAGDVPLKDAKLNIEHNATDEDTGFQGFVDSEGWQRLDVTGPNGQVLGFEGRGSLAQLGLTELFFETVEPENRDVPIKEMLAKLPEGRYTFSGPTQENGQSSGQTSGKAWLTHDIPAGPKLASPKEGARLSRSNVVARWRPVRETITGERVKIISYQLIVEEDIEPHRHMIGKRGLSMYLPPTRTRVKVPKQALRRHTKYAWEVLAIERSGNQTLSSGSFRTK